jgi:hypothetical protein
MSAAQHEVMAEQAERSATALQAQACNPRSATCWTSTAHPTAEDQRQANELRKAAADHRAASQALRDAEAQACVGLSNDDRDMSPFAHREDVASVEPLYEQVTSGKGPRAKMEGAVVTFRAVPGMTAQWLQRLADCHLARNAALGHDVPEMPYCPLVPKGVTATVTPTATGFAVAIRAEDTETANEVLRRARTLVTP